MTPNTKLHKKAHWYCLLQRERERVCNNNLTQFCYIIFEMKNVIKYFQLDKYERNSCITNVF